MGLPSQKMSRHSSTTVFTVNQLMLGENTTSIRTCLHETGAKRRKIFSLIILMLVLNMMAAHISWCSWTIIHDTAVLSQLHPLAQSMLSKQSLIGQLHLMHLKPRCMTTQHIFGVKPIDQFGKFETFSSFHIAVLSVEQNEIECFRNDLVYIFGTLLSER